MDQNTKTFSPRIIIQLIVVVIILPLLPMLISWRWSWWQAWAFALICTLGFVISRVLASRRHPDIIAERAGSLNREDAKPWDRLLAPLMGMGGLVVPLIAGLEDRFNWSPAPFGLPLNIAAILLMILAYAFSSWALIENRYFSGVVRIQAERGHEVVSSGPYAWMRHPGYAGSFWSYLAMPFILDSAWAFIPAVVLIGVMILRTSLEDRTLQEELPGYRDYARKVRYRLFPGIW